MTFTNEELVSNIEVLSQLHETGKVGYAVARNLRKMKNEVSDYVKFRDDLFQKYGNQIEDTNRFVIPKNKIQEFQNELGNLPLTEIEVDVFTVSEDEFISSSMNSSQMETLLWMIREVEGPEEK